MRVRRPPSATRRIYKIALLTRAARGLGRAIALALAGAGANLVLGLRDVRADGNLVREIESLGRQAIAVQMDVTDSEQVGLATREGSDRFGEIHILVNNA